MGLLTATIAIAANVHFVPGNVDQPDFEDEGASLSASGSLAGLGEGDLLIELEAEGLPEVSCTNPSGKNKPPGQNPASVGVTGSEPIPADEIKNGRVSFSVSTEALVEVEGACPGSNWTSEVIDVAFTNAVLTVLQGGIVVLTADCEFDPPTDDGPVREQDLSCTVVD